MRVRTRSTVAVAGISVLALGLAACGGSSDDAGGGDGASGSMIYANSTPQNPLIPALTNETAGGDILDALFTGLINYSPDDASPVDAVAKSIEANDDSTVYTITLNDGWTFHDGTPVTASSFVDAWNWGAYGPNGAANSYFYDAIAGFDEVQGEDKNGDEAITKDEAPVSEMSGLKVVSDTEFTVTMASPNSTFPSRLGYIAYAPLPESFFTACGDDPAAASCTDWAKNPIGNGPYKATAVDPAVAVDVEAYADYKGPDKATISKISFKNYQTLEAAYADLQANNVDWMNQVPVSALAGDAYQTDLDGRFVDKPIGTFASITYPLYDKRFDNVQLRQAISMAIDRAAIIKSIFNGKRTQAGGWVSPVVDGYKEGVCGEYCEFNAEKAQAALKAAGGWTGTLTISYNADGGHKEWVEATCGSIKNTLGIDCQAKPYVDFATFLDARDNEEMDGLFRTGWQMDYPSIENFLAPLYYTGAGSNDGAYSSEKFDSLIDQANAAAGEEGIKLFQDAEAQLAADMPVIPMWYGQAQSGYSTNITNIKVTPFGTLDLSSVKAS
jgi:oligopeptide transport system substrate-binding protein